MKGEVTKGRENYGIFGIFLYKFSWYFYQHFFCLVDVYGVVWKEAIPCKRAHEQDYFFHNIADCRFCFFRRGIL